jgi:glycosyltransferase involved in cell wall biosynthesis
LFAENFEDFKEKLAKLIHDKELRKTLRENGLKNREKLHITEVLKNYYIPFFKKIIKQ